MPDVPTNGQVSSSDIDAPFPVDTVLTYTCDAGYTLDGESETQCSADGTWSNGPPTCNGKFCCSS